MHLLDAPICVLQVAVRYVQWLCWRRVRPVFGAGLFLPLPGIGLLRPESLNSGIAFAPRRCTFLCLRFRAAASTTIEYCKVLSPPVGAAAVMRAAPVSEEGMACA